MYNYMSSQVLQALQADRLRDADRYRRGRRGLDPRTDEVTMTSVGDEARWGWGRRRLRHGATEGGLS